jgi:hypothetical protein
MSTDGALDEDAVVRIVRTYIEGLFPKVCPRCGRRYDSLRDYLKATSHLAAPVLYDDIRTDIPAEPIGPMSLANCPCGTTMAIGSGGIPPWQLVELLTWAQLESSARAISVRELLRHIRERIDEQVLSNQSAPAMRATNAGRP